MARINFTDSSLKGISIFLRLTNMIRELVYMTQVKSRESPPGVIEFYGKIVLECINKHLIAFNKLIFQIIDQSSDTSRS